MPIRHTLRYTIPWPRPCDTARQWRTTICDPIEWPEWNDLHTFSLLDFSLGTHQGDWMHRYWQSPICGQFFFVTCKTATSLRRRVEFDFRKKSRFSPGFCTSLFLFVDIWKRQITLARKGHNRRVSWCLSLKRIMFFKPELVGGTACTCLLLSLSLSFTDSVIRSAERKAAKLAPKSVPNSKLGHAVFLALFLAPFSAKGETAAANNHRTSSREPGLLFGAKSVRLLRGGQLQTRLRVVLSKFFFFRKFFPSLKSFSRFRKLWKFYFQPKSLKTSPLKKGNLTVRAMAWVVGEIY